MKNIDPNFLARSREAFISRAAETLADLKTRIEADNALTGTSRRDLVSAFNRIQKAAGRDLTSIPATAPAVRQLFACLSPVALGVSEKTFANFKSSITRSMRKYCVTPVHLSRRVPFAPPWRELLDRVTTEYQRVALYRLAAYCTVMAIAPHEVCNTTLLGLHEALDAEEIIKHPRGVLKNTISNWNRCRRTVTDWPDITLSSPFKPVPFTLPLAAFPESFQTAVRQWAELMADPDPLDEDAPVRALRQATIDHRILQIRQFASALVHRGDLKSEELTSFTVLFEPAHFKSALRFFLDRNGGKTTARLHNQANSLRYIAKNYCKLDQAKLDELARMARRLDPGGSRQMTQKNRERLRQFDDPRNVGRLLRFPGDQAIRAREEKNPLRAAKRIECALAAALLISCGLRMGTLRALAVDDFTCSRSNGQGVWHLSVPGHKMKGNRPIEFELPTGLVEILSAYLKTYRPRLPGAHSCYLFPGQDGGKRSRHAISDILRNRLYKDAGLVMHPHLFRHAIAKIVVERDPGAYLAISRVLAHTSLDTTMAHYFGTESKAAGRRVDQALEEAEAQAPQSVPRKRRPRAGK